MATATEMAMEMQLDPTTLTAFDGAAAGHDGVLSDPSGELVIKPCTQAEVDFYQSANASHPELAHFMPAFIGTMQRGVPEVPAPSGPPGILGLTDVRALNLPATHPPSYSIPPDDATGTAATLDINDPGPLKGKKLDTELHIVLENVASGFKQPNILDLKLGARLWDDDSKLEKRARLDKVAGETTSGSLGFRIAGMRIWEGQNALNINHYHDGKVLSALDADTKYRSFNKLYGRTFTAENVIEAFKYYLQAPPAGIDNSRSLAVTKAFLKDIKEIQEILEKEESRMYSASILLVYEGDPVAFREATEAASNTRELPLDDDIDTDREDEDEDDEVEKKAFAVKLIDFAHASWTPGLGPDQNMLQGVRSAVKILQELEAEFSTSRYP